MQTRTCCSSHAVRAALQFWMAYRSGGSRPYSLYLRSTGRDLAPSATTHASSTKALMRSCRACTHSHRLA